MKYSYMATKEYHGKFKVESFGSDHFIDSDERLLGFRNQYGEKFVLAPWFNIRWFGFIVFVIGIAVGNLLGRI